MARMMSQRGAARNAKTIYSIADQPLPMVDIHIMDSRC
jgi:hypothetical protein